MNSQISGEPLGFTIDRYLRGSEQTGVLLNPVEAAQWHAPRTSRLGRRLQPMNTDGRSLLQKRSSTSSEKFPTEEQLRVAAERLYCSFIRFSDGHQQVPPEPHIVIPADTQNSCAADGGNPDLMHRERGDEIGNRRGHGKHELSNVPVLTRHLPSEHQSLEGQTFELPQHGTLHLGASYRSGMPPTNRSPPRLIPEAHIDDREGERGQSSASIGVQPAPQITIRLNDWPLRIGERLESEVAE